MRTAMVFEPGISSPLLKILGIVLVAAGAAGIEGLFAKIN
jgi:hypothetical protein